MAGFKFPDEIDETPAAQAAAPEETIEDIELEVVDDTPPQDRGREPLPSEIVEELEKDDLEEYSEKVKKRLSQMKKVWHDERRAKDSAAREREEAFRVAQAYLEENRQLKQQLGAGKKLIAEEITKSANAELLAAKQRLKEAYESGDASLITDAQEELTDAKLRLREVNSPSLHASEIGVETKTEQVQPRQMQQNRDLKAEAWKAKNTWFGADEEMTALALGLHEKLVRSGVDPTSDDYYRRVDETIRRRFPEQFEEAKPEPTEAVDEKPAPRKAATVVAPATRSTAPKQVRLTNTQMALAKKLGLKPEVYAKAVLNLEKQNG
jgi:hypothetical protein